MGVFKMAGKVSQECMFRNRVESSDANLVTLRELDLIILMSIDRVQVPRGRSVMFESESRNELAMSVDVKLYQFE